MIYKAFWIFQIGKIITCIQDWIYIYWKFTILNDFIQKLQVVYGNIDNIAGFIHVHFCMFVKYYKAPQQLQLCQYFGTSNTHCSLTQNYIKFIGRQSKSVLNKKGIRGKGRTLITFVLWHKLIKNYRFINHFSKELR